MLSSRLRSQFNSGKAQFPFFLLTLWCLRVVPSFVFFFRPEGHCVYVEWECLCVFEWIWDSAVRLRVCMELATEAPVVIGHRFSPPSAMAGSGSTTNRSRLVALFACFLEGLGIDIQFEPKCMIASSGHLLPRGLYCPVSNRPAPRVSCLLFGHSPYTCFCGSRRRGSHLLPSQQDGDLKSPQKLSFLLSQTPGFFRGLDNMIFCSLLDVLRKRRGCVLVIVEAHSEFHRFPTAYQREVLWSN